ncbi:hypothetical protein FXO38_16997 [Capsicum annuum]|nr:hypothetical protein FXO37_32986 [Capsicum annuum]KAF3650728.1 hypothetical protein FXO38_16997 [Capsicum annuum]
MNSLVSNTSLRLSKRVNGYEPLNQSQVIDAEIGDDDEHSHRRPQNMTMKMRRSTRMHRRSPVVWSSLSYKRERARKRHIFLQSYKLEPYDNSRRNKLKKIVVKVNSIMVSVLSFMRSHTLGPDCNCQSSIHVVPPTRIISYH